MTAKQVKKPTMRMGKPGQPASAEDFIDGAPSVTTPDRVEGNTSGGYVRVNLQLTVSQHEVLRRLSFDRRQSQAELVRAALDAWLPQQLG